MADPTTPKTEYRVAWRRLGSKRREVIFKTLVGAQRRVAFVNDSDNDPHWKCDEDHAYCMERLELHPVIEYRIVHPWRPFIEEPPRGG